MMPAPDLAGKAEIVRAGPAAAALPRNAASTASLPQAPASLRCIQRGGIAGRQPPELAV